ncbi:MAG: AbrB/MazE/SpoVT family DNA-binding domain-containing protein [bacterium]
MKSGLATILTERGQISIPAAIRKKANLVPGQRLLWHQTGHNTFSVTLETVPKKRRRAVGLIGYARRFFPDGGMPKRTDEVLKLLRQGEE